MSSTFLSWSNSPRVSPNLPQSDNDPKDPEKKSRHRHTPSQLAALNELYDQTEHPALDQRTHLAERLGMETKTVNAWFQNKRASTKKRSRGGQRSDLPHPPSLPATTRHPELEDFPDGDDPPLDNACLLVSFGDTPQQSAFYKALDNSHLFAEPESMPRKMRIRPTAHQTEELKRLYSINPHPSREEREDLGERIGMRYQSITNWFQNQRSLAKKRKEDDADAAITPAPKSSKLEQSRESRTFSAFPPPSNHPSLPLSHSVPPPKPRPSHSDPTRASTSFPLDPARGSTPTRNKLPYRRGVGSPSRTRRTRPEPYQLDALKDLFTRTANPSIEQRSALALEIGMDIGKVTNWFRNLRQTARKRAKKGEGDDDVHLHLPLSRSGTPSLNSSSSSSTNEGDDLMDLDDNDYDTNYKHRAHSDMVSDDEYQEAVASSPELLPPPVASAPPHHIRMGHQRLVEPPYANPEKGNPARFSDIKLDDALLLLSFHHHIVH